MQVFNILKENLLLSENQLNNFIATCPHRYKKYEIPKRNSNQMRTIAHPSKELKKIQRLLVKHLQETLPIHESACAYKKKASIKINAQYHQCNEYLLKLDFKNFFPSIKPILFIDTLKRHNIIFDDRDLFLLKNIIFWKPKRNADLELSIGAPSSPLISNFIMYDFDHIITLESAKLGITYTRYADDLSFSTNQKDILFEIPKLISDQLRLLFKGQLSLNETKTKFSSKKFNRHITGVTITNNNKLSVGRDRKRKISAMIHRFSKSELNEKEIEKLKGYFAFANYIDQDFYAQMEKKYTKIVINDLVKVKK